MLIRLKYPSNKTSLSELPIKLAFTNKIYLTWVYMGFAELKHIKYKLFYKKHKRFIFLLLIS